jgi:WD40 repeat protein
MGSRVDCMKFAPHNQALVAGSLDSSFIVFSLGQNKTVCEQRMANTGGVKDVLFIDDHTLLTSGQDSVTRKWEIGGF